MQFAYISCTTYTDYLKKALNAVKYSTNYTRVNAAISHIDAALAYEVQGLPYTALTEIKKAFPEV